MRNFLFLSITIVLLYSCNTEMLSDEEISKGQQTFDFVYPEQIDGDEINPDAALYYKNLSTLALWYARNPLFRTIPGQIATRGSENNVLGKFESMTLIDSLGNRISMFDLNEIEMKNFLENWQNVEAYNLTQKIEKDTTATSLSLFKERNSAYADAGINFKSTSITEDPYFKIKSELDNREKRKIENQVQLPVLKAGELTDDYFWATVIANGLMSLSVIQAAPNRLTPQTFVDRIRPAISKGRIIVALPGGWTTSSLIVFYPNKTWYDVGHVAIIEKDAVQIPDSIDSQFTFTIGTGVDGTHYEVTAQKWCVKHGLAFVCKATSTSWEMYKTDVNKKWKWRKVVVEVDGEKLIEKATSCLTVPYCSTIDVFFSKWVAPKSFICSSLAWYCTRETAGVDISDWWSTSVYPVDILFSENIQIVDDTLD